MKKTKELLIKNALELFMKNGFSETSIQEIIDKSKVSKGAFYHYFSSKEDILSEIAEIQTKEAAKIIKNVIEDKKLNALEKFNKIIADIQSYKVNYQKNKANLKKVFQGQIQDPNMQHKMKEMTKKIIVPPMKALFNEGVEQGVFKTDYPDELAEHYFEIMASMRLSLVKPTLELNKNPENIKIIKQKLYFFQDLLERLLGVKKGSVLFAQPLLKRYSQK